jgi:hypothetical protein
MLLIIFNDFWEFIHISIIICIYTLTHPVGPGIVFQCIIAVVYNTFRDNIDFAEMLREIINDKIKECKDVHEYHIRIDTDRLMIQIQVLEWFTGFSK